LKNKIIAADWHFIVMLMPWIKGNGQRGFKDEDLQKIVKRERCSRITSREWI
jgi:hypothetical protein